MSAEFIVFEGIDGCGKSTQTNLLINKFEKREISYEFIHFPVYDTFYGGLVKKYLNGELGSMQELPVEIPCLLYAMDRLNQRDRIRTLLKNGVHVVCDRYYASNLAYQTAKYECEEEGRSIEDWLEHVESRIPKPTITLLLDIPPRVTQNMMKERSEKDIHEVDLSYQKRVRRKFLELTSKKDWSLIECYKNKKLRSKKSIHEEVWNYIKKRV